jgi:Ca2+:H+ antiporter
VPALSDKFYLEAVRPYCWFAAVLLFLSYVIGLWFTLRTHAAVIWNNEVDEKRAHDMAREVSSVQQQPFGGAPHGRLQRQVTQTASTEAVRAEIRDSQLYKKILGQSLKQAGLGPREDGSRQNSAVEPTGPNGVAQTPHLVPPKSSGEESARSEVQIPGVSEEQNASLVREVAEMAATAATTAARDATRAPRKTSLAANTPHSAHKPPTIRAGVVHGADPEELAAVEAHVAGGGHDAPNWSRMKSSIILCGATILYALIAEILVNTVDVVLKNVAIDEKFLGITLFALVPNTTEFLVSLISKNSIVFLLTCLIFRTPSPLL